MKARPLCRAKSPRPLDQVVVMVSRKPVLLPRATIADAMMAETGGLDALVAHDNEQNDANDQQGGGKQERCSGREFRKRRQQNRLLRMLLKT